MFPLYKNIISFSKIEKHYNGLRCYPSQLIDIKLANKIAPNYDFEKIHGKYAIVLDNYEENNKINHITDYFCEVCRIHCKKHNRDKNPIEVFKDIHKDIRKKSKNDKEFYNNITHYLWQNSYLCQLFKVTIIRQLYMYFNAQNILDFSAGWGDRLIAASSIDGVRYTGVDPSECMKPIYTEIIETLIKDSNNFRVINEPFEAVDLGNEMYDFIFSSPPFFKLEIFESNNKLQSVNLYDEIDDWKNKFLFVTISKCNSHLTNKGYFCIHVSDYKDIRFVDDMMDYIKSNTQLKYVGKFYYIYKYDETNTYSKPLFIRIFRKS